MPCRALPCFAMLRALLYFFTSSYLQILFEGSSYHVPVLLILHQVCTYGVVLGSQTTYPQLNSARLYIAQQCSAAQCGAVPCPSFCGAVSCGAVRSFEHTAAVTSSRSSTKYDTDTRFMYVFCVLVLLLSSVDCPLSAPMPLSPANIARTAGQNVTSTSTQHSAGQLALRKHLSALLSIRYSHQIITGLFFLPHLFTCFS